MRRVVRWGLAALVLGSVAVVLAHRPVLEAVGRFLILEETPAPAQAIVVLSGSVPDRILEAVDLYQAHLAPRIILTQEGMPPGLAALRQRGGSMEERHEQNQHIARQLGVPAAAISMVTAPAWSTVTEAEAVIDYLHQQGITSILLVTSKPHARRAALTYRDLAGRDLQIRVCPSRYDNFAPQQWWQRRPFARRLVTEYLKLFNYLLIDRWRVRPVEGGVA